MYMFYREVLNFGNLKGTVLLFSVEKLMKQIENKKEWKAKRLQHVSCFNQRSLDYRMDTLTHDHEVIALVPYNFPQK